MRYVEKMQESDDPIKYLPLPEEFEPSAEKAAAAIYGTVSEPSPTPRFDLTDDCLPVVEAKKLYQKEKSLLIVPDPISHGVVLEKSFSAGGKHDAIIVPLVAIKDPKIYAWAPRRKQNSSRLAVAESSICIKAHLFQC
ncbi:hypothetical protein BDDG_04831 [Blastomyces dermatitidis ATCC 18188]|uniref:Uncharacterized protein n=1 Tax=Ajellomyces dermatitidis (strain ATCC 18188 / CBS 674.68) TaxID=653446 RepID=F2TF75_AJEDA|nr:hypothetical protein BDDG_04831 [Blastomyces dermatitidis ATCC 18188]